MFFLAYVSLTSFWTWGLSYANLVSLAYAFNIPYFDFFISAFCDASTFRWSRQVDVCLLVDLVDDTRSRGVIAYRPM